MTGVCSMQDCADAGTEKMVVYFKTLEGNQTQSTMSICPKHAEEIRGGGKQDLSVGYDVGVDEAKPSSEYTITDVIKPSGITEITEDDEGTELTIKVNGFKVAFLNDNGNGMDVLIDEGDNSRLGAAELIQVARWILEKAEGRARMESMV